MRFLKMSNEPTIIWEKWIDPYELNIDDIEWPGYNFLKDNEQNIDEDDEENIPIKYQKINAISTRMGIIPYNEYTDCTKIFNFWIGHTNFSITEKIADKLQNVIGVETLDIFTRYRFRISFGKAFIDRDVINSINELIKSEITE